MRRFYAMAATLLLSACSGEPPAREYHQAQGAIEAAREADAARYAPADYQAAVDALKQYDAAVAQRDYRLALSAALEAFNRARAAAKVAANEKAAVRSRAETALAEASGAAAAARQLLPRSAEAKLPAARVAQWRKSIEHVEIAVQKARAALQAGDYLQAAVILKGIDEEGRRTVAEIQAGTRNLPPRKSDRTPGRTPR